jgi:predicted Rossmann fold flavoprotein
MSRYYLMEKGEDAGATLTVNWVVDQSPESFEAALLALGKKQPISLLREHLPERMAKLLLGEVENANNDVSISQLTRPQRKQLVALATRYPLPIAGDRGFNYAEVTAGGVPLAELNLKTMESRICPNLHIVGELCDVDGRIGGFNFQWAWSSGYVAGVAKN